MKNILNLQWQILSPELRVALKIDIIICKFIKKNFCHVLCPWPQNELLDRLTRPTAEGLRQYWFGEIEFSQQWFKKHVQDSIASLDERFHPEDHVDVRIQKLFAVIARHPSWIEELKSKLSAITDNLLSTNQFSKLTAHSCPALPLEELSHAQQQLLAVQDDFSMPLQKDWNIEKWIVLTNNLLSELKIFFVWCRTNKKKIEEESHANNKIRASNSHQEAAENFLTTIETAAEDFLELCMSTKEFMKAEQGRLAFIKGEAGTGKSHLFGKEASRLVEEGGAVILALGQRMNDEEPWSQFAKLFHLPNINADVLLGALDAAGEESGKRALLLIDAINEGPGSRYWHNHILSFVEMIRGYKNIACLVSCRTAYFSIAIPNSLSRKTPTFSINGFERPEEQANAAKVFLDRRGIVRPSTPWLTPEFVNPLFLRSVCDSLKRQGKSEFPTGLHGISLVLAYYLDSVGENIKVAKGSLSPLSDAVKKSVVELARTMISHREDYLLMSEAEQVVKQAFPQALPDSDSETSWLSVLLSNGIIRRDPNPRKSDAPLAGPEDVVRLSFQRFQDFLMAEVLVDDQKDAGALFSNSGPLQFMLEEGTISWKWRGLFEALSSIIPEKFNCELFDILPEGLRQDCKALLVVSDAFFESVKWRKRSAFTDRSLELFKQLGRRLEVLLEIAVSSDHPWNAELLHRILQRLKLPERDAFWTVWLNKQSAENDSSVGQLIDWCLSEQLPRANPKNQILAALTLCWFFTASNRSIRDKATKALASLFIARADIFLDLLERFRTVDDLYVLERLLAAAYGASCLDPSQERLTTYSSLVFNHIFKSKTPPLGLRLRDCALGIIELAQYHNALASEVDFDRCKPPYQSKRVRLSVTEEQLKAVAKNAEGEAILRSATGLGNFGNYQIQPRISLFSSLPLRKSVTLTSEQHLRVFEKEVVETTNERIATFDRLRTVAYGVFDYKELLKDAEKSEIDQPLEDIETAEDDFLRLLSNEENERFKNEAAPVLYGRTEKTKKPKQMDTAAAMRWVANRAYQMGWTAKRFAYDNRVPDYSEDRPIVERIGKKYQWLALDELLCRLADNNWLAGDYGDMPRRYSCPADVNFHRDVDPTILEEKEIRDSFDKTSQGWAAQPIITLPKVSEDELAAWPFQDDPARLLKSMVERQDKAGTDWVVLYEHQAVTGQYSTKQQQLWEHGFRQKEFRFLMSFFVQKEEVGELISMLKKKKKLCDWQPPVAINKAFLYEAPWRTTWPDSEWRFDYRDVPEGEGIDYPVWSYTWESQLDASLPNGFNTHLPAPWLAKMLKLAQKLNQTGCWTAPNGETVFMEIAGKKGNVLCLLRKDFASRVIVDHLCILWLFVAERTAWPGGNNDNAAWRSSEGLCWHDGTKLMTETWKQDDGNGTSADMLKKNKKGHSG